MKYLFSILIIAFSFLQGFAQDLGSINSMRIKKTKGSLIALGGWSVGNIATGLALRGEEGSESYYFHSMNVGWNAVNLGISVLGYIATNKEDYTEYGLRESLDKQREIEVSYLVNGALDLAYMTGGVYLIERGKNEPENTARFTGFGKSIILQGGYLLVLDIVSYIIHVPERKRLNSILDDITVTSSGISLSIGNKR